MDETQWYCAKCNEKMTKKKIPTIFMGKIGFEEGYFCPRCKTRFFSEDVVQRSIAAKEVDAEGKLQ